MIFIDSNIPMYLVGGSIEHKTNAQILVERVTASQERVLTSAEVFQEILHRYSAIRRPEAIDFAFELLLQFVDDVLPVEKNDVLRAREIIQLPRAPTARDALHLAVMERHGVQRIMSFDSDFDRWPGIERVWRL